MSSGPECIVDTVVLLYFLLVDEDRLLRDLLGGALKVPRTVYDPDDRSLPESALRRSDLLSEMRQSIRHHEVAVRHGETDPESIHRVRSVDHLYDTELLEVIDMTGDELAMAARLQSRDAVQYHSIRAPLGPGESACVAIAWHREWTIVTDDDAALTVLDELHGGRSYMYERIRKLLIRAAMSKQITRTQANDLHGQMRNLGFWDSGRPFPQHRRQ